MTTCDEQGCNFPFKASEFREKHETWTCPLCGREWESVFKEDYGEYGGSFWWEEVV